MSKQTGYHVDVNVENDDGDTPLILALDEGDEELVVRLIKAGADTTTENSSGRLVVHAAARNGYCEVVELLIAQDTGLIDRDNSRITALHGASGNGHLNVAKLLLDKGADPNAGSDKGGQTPLGSASSAGPRRRSTVAVWPALEARSNAVRCLSSTALISPIPSERSKSASSKLPFLAA